MFKSIIRDEPFFHLIDFISYVNNIKWETEIYVFKNFYKMPFPSKSLPLLLIILLFYYASFAAAAEPSIQQPQQVYNNIQTNSEAHYIHID